MTKQAFLNRITGHDRSYQFRGWDWVDILGIIGFILSFPFLLTYYWTRELFTQEPL